jgi:hypothetical protein
MSVDKGGGGGASTSTQTSNTTVNVSTNVTGPPINIAVGSDFLKPVAESFLPIADSVKQGIASISSQAQSIAEFTNKSNQALTVRQNELDKLIKIAVGLALAGLGYSFIQRQRRAT